MRLRLMMAFDAGVRREEMLKIQLKHVNFTLGTIIAGVRAIELASRPVNPVLGDIAGELAATQSALDNLLAAKAARAQRAPVLVATARTAPKPARAPAPATPDGDGQLFVSRLPTRRE